MVEGSWKLVVKNGDIDYSFNTKKGTYDSKTIDYVEEFSDWPRAFSEFFNWIDDPYLENRVNLSFKPKKKSDKNTDDE